MPKRTATGALLSDDGMWWWDGSRWRAATPATAGKPPRAPTSPWAWLGIGCLALLLVTAIPAAWTWGRLAHDPHFEIGFARGFAQTYVQQRQAALAQLDADLTALSACERTSSQPCYAASDTLRSAAAGESQTINGEVGLFFFPACLKSSAAAETQRLGDVATAAGYVRNFEPSSAAFIGQQLRVIGGALSAAKGEVAAAQACA